MPGAGVAVRGNGIPRKNQDSKELICLFGEINVFANLFCFRAFRAFRGP
jgi:hypothetical protein